MCQTEAMPHFVAGGFGDANLAGVEYEHGRVRIPIKAINVGDATATAVECNIFSYYDSHAPFRIGATGVAKILHGRRNRCYVDLERRKILSHSIEGSLNDGQF